MTLLLNVIPKVLKQLLAGFLQNRCSKKIAKFMEKHLCKSHFSNNKSPRNTCFPVNFAIFLENLVQHCPSQNKFL